MSPLKLKGCGKGSCSHFKGVREAVFGPCDMLDAFSGIKPVSVTTLRSHKGEGHMVSKEAMVSWVGKDRRQALQCKPSCRTRKSQNVGSNAAVQHCADAKATAGIRIKQATSR